VPLMNVVVRVDGEPISLLVDEIGDVVEIDPARLERSPNNLNPLVRDLIARVYKLDDQLLLILDVSALIELSAEPRTTMLSAHA
jgi:purine-binding chemotaxis protein CheW